MKKVTFLLLIASISIVCTATPPASNWWEHCSNPEMTMGVSTFKHSKNGGYIILTELVEQEGEVGVVVQNKLSFSQGEVNIETTNVTELERVVSSSCAEGDVVGAEVEQVFTTKKVTVSLKSGAPFSENHLDSVTVASDGTSKSASSLVICNRVHQTVGITCP